MRKSQRRLPQRRCRGKRNTLERGRVPLARNRISISSFENFTCENLVPKGWGHKRQQEEYRQFLRRAIKTQLTKRQQQVVVLYYLQQKNICEISRELNLNKSTVSRTMARAMARLRDLAQLYFQLQ